MKLFQKYWLFTIALALCWGFSSGVYAQQEPSSQPEQGFPQDQGLPPNSQNQDMTPGQQGAPFEQQPQGVREDFSKKELEKFVSAATKVQEVQASKQEEIVAAIEAEDLDVNRFNEIIAVRQGKTEDTTVTDEELQSFNIAAQKVMEHNQEMQTEIAQTIEEEGLTPETYNEILLAYQESPKIQKKITKMLEKEEE